MKYVSVIVDNNTNATDDLYTYVSDFTDIKVGDKVTVPFAKSNRIVDGYVASVTDEMPETKYGFKKIRTIDPDFSLSEEAIDTALWMHQRYICRYIEAVRCFLPTNTLAKRKTKDPFEGIEEQRSDAIALNEEQTKAYNALCDSIDSKKHDIFLLNGVTGSGKTEVYLQAMEECLRQGREGIVLVPEISLTPQTVSRFVNRFGKEQIAILHSKLTPQQRYVEYKKIQNKEVKLVIGVRSAIFAPFENIGLIIIDEEHETSYKSDKSPKYDAIEVATKRAISHNACLVLGSATPAVQDYYRSKNKIFKELVIKNRYNKVPLPKVSVVDMRKEIKAGNRSLFSSMLCKEMRECFDDDKQVILFLNRRGYSSFVSCRECGYTMKCSDCGVSLTYHKSAGAMICHYCGRRQLVPKLCPECGSKLIGRFGAGTEQVEEKAKELFPDKTIERLDLDVASKKGATESILKRFAKGKTDILIGTQLVAKGLDFANVGLVGIISADVTLNIPDFRSAERSFQLVTQAAGRSGRGDKQGKVVIQTYSPEHPAIVCASNQDYQSFYKQEIKLRQLAMYPPFADICQIILSHEKERSAAKSAEVCADILKRNLDDSYLILGPCKAPLNKAGNQFRYQIIVKAPAGQRKALSNLLNNVKKNWKEEALLTVDINPYSLL